MAAARLFPRCPWREPRICCTSQTAQLQQAGHSAPPRARWASCGRIEGKAAEAEIVRSGLAPAYRVRWLPLLLALALAPLAFLAGCDNINNPPYPSAMRYPLREDPLVLTPPKNTILFPFAERPGHLEQTVTTIPAIEGAEGNLPNPNQFNPP